MALDIDTALGWRGKTIVDRDGEKIGKLGDVYLDRETDLPAYAAVETGLFGTQESYLRLQDAEAAGDEIRVPYEKALVRDAPRIDPDVALTAEEERRLDEHYGAASAPARDAGAVTAGRDDVPAAEGREDAPAAEGREDAPAAEGREDAPDRDDDSVEMVRSEEEARLRTTGPKPAERVRLKKVTVTDHVERTVPVRREEVRLEHEPPPEGRVVDVEEE